MKSFSFSESEHNINNFNASMFYSPHMHDTVSSKTYLDAMTSFELGATRMTLNFQNVTGEAVPDDVVNHFKKQNNGLICSELVKLSDYKAQYPDGKFDPDPYLKKNDPSTFKTLDFFGKEEVYILASQIPEYKKVMESKSCQLYNEFAKPFIANNPTLVVRPGQERFIEHCCQNIIGMNVSKQPEIKMEIFKNGTWGDIFTDSIRKDLVSRLAGCSLAEEFGPTKKTLTNIKLSRIEIYTEIADKCRGGGLSHDATVKVMEAFNKAAQDQLKDFKQKYNELRPEFDKSQPFKNQAFDIVDKLSDKFHQAVQGLKKVWQVVTTKNLAIEQSKDKQQTVQPQKNTPEVKQQSKAKDMER